MPVRNIVLGQAVSPEKVLRAKQLRRDMAPEEHLIWERVRANRVLGLRFRRQQVIDGFIADFYCHAAALVIEIDGPVHAEREAYDAARDLIFRQRGFTILRFSNARVREDLDDVMTDIVAACQKTSPP